MGSIISKALGDMIGSLGLPVPDASLWLPLRLSSAPKISANGVTPSTETSDPDGRFHRRSDGLFTTPVATQIRIGGENYAMRRQGALFEPARSNYGHYSNFLSAWTRGPDIGVLSNLVGPDGVASSAWTVSDLAVTDGYQVIYPFWNVIVTGTSIRPSVYVKELTSTQFSLIPQPNTGWVGPLVKAHFTWSGGEVIDGAHENCSAIIEPPIAAGGWWRTTVVPDILTDVTHIGRFYFYPTGYGVQIAGTIGVCHASVEIGAYPTSHIVTSGTGTVPRNADVLIYPSTDFGAGDLTVCGSFTPQWNGADEATDDHAVLATSDAINGVIVYHDATGTVMADVLTAGATVTVNSLQAIERGARYAFCLRLDGAAAVLTVKESGQAANEASGIITGNPAGHDPLRLGSLAAGSGWGGSLRDILGYQRALTDGEAAKMLAWLLTQT